MIAGPEDPTNEGPWCEGPGGERFAVRLSSKKTKGAYAIIESVAPPGYTPPMHVHRNEEQHFVVLAGTYRILIEDRLFHAPTGTSITVPRGSRHSWRNMSKETGRLLLILTPGGFEDCIQTICDRPEDNPVEIVARYGCFVVGHPLSN